MRNIRRTVMLIIGWALLIPGLVFVVLPPPFAFGAVMVLAGVAILVAHSRFMRRVVQWVRAHFPFVDRAMRVIEQRLPDWVRRQLKRTRPEALRRAFRRRRRHRPSSHAGQQGRQEPGPPARIDPDPPHSEA